MRWLALGAATLFAATLLVGMSSIEVTPASAASLINCNGVVCEAQGAVFGTGSNATGGNSSGGTPGSSTGGGAGGVTSTTYQACQAWGGAGGAAYSSKYPANYLAQKVNSYSCAIAFSAGQGISCPVGAGGIPPIGRYNTTVTYTVGGAKVTTSTGYRCYYPAGPDKPVYSTTTQVCYVSGDAWWYLNSQTPSNGVGKFRTGTQLSSYPGGAKSTGWSASNPTANCGGINLNFNAQTQIVNGVPTFSYYTMSFQVKYVTVNHSVMPAVWRQPAIDIISRPMTANTTQPYTYSCQLNPALKGGVITGVSFDPATCAASQWSCQVGPITINGSNQPQTVMRNGEQITVKASPFSVSGPGVRNISNPQYKWGMAGTPVNSLGGDINSSKQYFKLRDNPSGVVPNAQGRQELFGNWYPNPNANLNKSIEFYWASDVGKPWSLTESYQFTGEFLVNTQAGLGSGSTQSWVKSFGHCSNFSSSNQVSVLRSVNSN